MIKHFLIILLVISQTAFANSNNQMENFIMKENLLKNNKIAVIATDLNDKPLEEISGTFPITINGFKQELIFHQGVAIIQQPVEKSTFIYLEYEKDSIEINRLYYIYKNQDSLNPININIKLLIIIPLIIISIIGLFRKFLVYGIIILIGFMYFNISKGLNIPTYIETILDGLKSFIF